MATDQACNSLIQFIVVPLTLVIAFAIYKVIVYVIHQTWIDPVSGRFVLVTGCDSGFGLAAASRLDSLGCHVFASCLTEEGQRHLQQSSSSRLRSFRMDIASKESVRNGYAFVVQNLPKHKGLWGLVNNAGVSSPALGPCEWQTVDDYRACMDVNFFGSVDVTLTFLPLVKKERGRIVMTSSVTGRVANGTPCHGPYGATKFALESFSDTLRLNMRWYDVRVSIIEPTFFPTRFLDPILKERQIRTAWEQATPEIRQSFGGPAYLDKLMKWFMETMDKNRGHRIDEVIEAYCSALFAQIPKARYPVGSGAGLLILISRQLPEWLSDRIISKITQFPRPQPARPQTHHHKQ